MVHGISELDMTEQLTRKHKHAVFIYLYRVQVVKLLILFFQKSPRIYHSALLCTQAVKLQGDFLSQFLMCNWRLSFAVIMQLSHDSPMLVMSVLLFCVISVTWVIIFNHKEQLNNQSQCILEKKNSCVNFLYPFKHFSEEHTILLSVKY